MKIAVIDGQGGGIGKAIIEKLSKVIDNDVEIIALGTNSAATTGMIKAGAKTGATGENAIKVTSKKVDVIVGPIAIMVVDSMMGEITSIIANSVSTSDAIKILVPLNRCNMIVAGIRDKKLNELIEATINEILDYLK
ncbi:MAG: DUF3842 family protein [Vallitalea sp.]|jgi:NAD(P)-dependent dehydrogenase (short-subunit alcohol dehydrogenase family)|nr:DUF3842 family protein [Vallitalea sp.]